MARDEGIEELVSVINQRIDVLAALSEPRAKRDLVEELSLSDSTVNRAVRQLESLGLVTRESEYRLTVAGELVVSAFEGFTEDLEDVVRLQGLLTALPPDAPMAVPMVRDATVHWSDEAAPTRLLDEAIEELADADHIRLMFPQVSRPDVLETLERRIVEESVPASLVLSGALVEHLRETGEWLSAVGGVDNCDIRVDDRLPYTLGVFQQSDGLHVGVVVYDRDGTVCGFVANDTLRAYAWGESVFRERKRAADPIEEST